MSDGRRLYLLDLLPQKLTKGSQRAQTTLALSVQEMETTSFWGDLTN